MQAFGGDHQTLTRIRISRKWKAGKMQVATNDRIPPSERTSMDAVLYAVEGYNVLSRALEAGGWKHVKPAENPKAKNRTFAYANFMY